MPFVDRPGLASRGLIPFALIERQRELPVLVRPQRGVNAFWAELTDAIEHLVILDAVEQPAPPPGGADGVQRRRDRIARLAETEKLLPRVRLKFRRAEQPRRGVMQNVIALQA